MYHIRRADTYEERSLHSEDKLGFQRAVIEALMRVSNTQVDHEILDGKGVVVHVVQAIDGQNIDVLAGDIAPIDGMAKVAIKPWKVSSTFFWASAAFIAYILARWIMR
jgi:hypothetical protein